MQDELRDLYHAQGNNPMCGDRLTVYLTVNDQGVIEDAAFEGRGCAISMASASLMTELVKGRSLAEAHRLFERFHKLCTEDGGAAETDGADEDALERLQVLSGVREFPVRVKCATLPWHTMNAAAIGHGEKDVTTE
jgi:nitrogen fixation NifU-like protein